MFQDRVDAGRQLAQLLADYQAARPVVIGLPRGGVVGAREVANSLHAPLDVIVVRKLGVPGHEEFAFGAVSEDDVLVIDHDTVTDTGMTQAHIDAVVAEQREELRRRLELIRVQHVQVELKDRVVIIVDDGVATGTDAKAACRVARARGAAKVVLATPVAPSDWRSRLGREADELSAVLEDPNFVAVGAYYESFTQTTDEQVLEALHD